MVFFFLAYLFFVLEIFMFLYYANEESDDIIGGPLKERNIQSRITLEILKQCSSNLAPAMYIRTNRMTSNMLLPWQHSWFQSLSVKNQISPFATF